MENFIVSARKYRPQNFNTVVGQSHITTTLKNAIKNNQLAHAFLFCGPRGVGKTTCARILAKTINCENRTADAEACNECNSCVTFDLGTSLNIHELDAASNNSVDDIRTLVDQVRFAPQAGKYKVYIVDEVHMLSSAAFNAFLKTLEEPPPFAIFILATTEKHKIIPTILSRCQIFDFKRITNYDTTHHLQEICDKEGIEADKAALHVISQKSEGCLRDALSILDKLVSFTNGKLTYSNTLEHLNILDENYYFQLIDAMQTQNISDALLMYDEINRKGFEGDLVINGLAECIRNILVSKEPKIAILLEVAEEFKEKYLQTAQRIQPGFLISALNILNDAEINYKQARNKRLHVEFTLIRLCYLQQAMELFVSESSAGKKKLVESSKTIAYKTILPIELKEKEKPNGFETIHGLQSKFAPPSTVLSQEDDLERAVKTRLIIEPDISVTKTSVAEGRIPVSSKAKPKLGALSRIREEVESRYKKEEKIIRTLNEEELHVAWGLYIEILRNKKNASTASNFSSALLKIIDPCLIEIVTESKIHQTFIESERAGLIEHLQNHFNNRNLTYRVVMIEGSISTDKQEKYLSPKEQYFRIIEEYPLVKKLKDRLRLELDY